MHFRDKFNRIFGVDVDKVQPHGKTRLQDAIDAGDLNRVKSLIEAGASPNDAGNLIHPPLHQAILRGDPTIAYYLLTDGKADANHLDFKGDAPLKLAVVKGDWFIAKEILERKGNPDVLDSERRTPLFFVHERHLNLIDLLTGHRANVNARDARGDTPLHHNAGSPELVAALLDAGANPAITNDAGVPAFQKVLENNPSDGDVVIALTRSGADMERPDKQGKTVLHYLVTGDNVRAVDHILKKSPVLSRTMDAEGKTPFATLLEASWPGHIGESKQDIIRLLIKAGADVNTVNSKGETWLHLAASGSNNIKVIETLVDNGADLNLKNGAGKTAVHIAAEKKLIDVLDALLDLGADPNVKDERGWTLLDQLAKNGDRDSMIVQRLIAGGGAYNKLLPQHPQFMKPHPAQPRVQDRPKVRLDKPKGEPKPPQA